MTSDEVIDKLQEKLKVLSETIWDRQHSLTQINAWSSQFSNDPNVRLNERVHALFLLSHFIYFGQREVRALLVSLYRDLFRAPVIRAIRRSAGDTKDLISLQQAYHASLKRTRFLGVGNPSESGSHPLYYFRQENSLPKSLFINSHEIFNQSADGKGSKLSIRDDKIQHYVFIDDLCGSGTQAKLYSEDLIGPIKRLAPDAKVHYLVMFGTVDGLDAVKQLKSYDTVESVFELDKSFRCLDENSRIFQPGDPYFVREEIVKTCQKFGLMICPEHPLGYKDGQLLMGFSHNTPDNTLPIFWGDSAAGSPWIPMFRRYDKNYG
jgi:hypothetical protein